MRRRVLLEEIRATVFFVSIVAWIGGFVFLVWAIYGLLIQRLGSVAQTTLVNGLYPNSIAVIENGVVALACFGLGIGGIVFLMLIREPLPEPHAERTLERAAALIQNKQYDEARTLLDSIPNDLYAHEWLARLDFLQEPVVPDAKASG